MTKLDSRHHIAKEFCGHAKARWVFRWCNDEFISSHATKREAQAAALQWEMERISRLLA
jgi:hypothetical protein